MDDNPPLAARYVNKHYSGVQPWRRACLNQTTGYYTCPEKTFIYTTHSLYPRFIRSPIWMFDVSTLGGDLSMHDGHIAIL
ncbi:hypothetical protein VN97_g8178 [Penicillium thymicola]|uniref:Uncharacterized protein n=1 Tax=Penicillium thymicola TaxID=293382 RepID=A0AAI9TEX3_PENTH|nr:hypothetical protein VN97_g8178 [Penicillium thymicola]